MTDPTQTPHLGPAGAPADDAAPSACCTPGSDCSESATPAAAASATSAGSVGSGPTPKAPAAKPAKPVPPRAHLLQDPRLKPLLAKAMRKHRLEEYFEHTVLRLVTGETDPRSLVCCNTGCRPCAKDYLGAADTVLRELGKKKKRFLFW